MAKGFLRVTGVLDLTQFWPDGESDADTAKVSVQSIEFSPDPASHLPFQPITIFKDAFITGGAGKPEPVIKNGRITARFQGIDANELHFAALLPKKGLKNNGTRYRQYFGETATVKLHDVLFGLQKKNSLPCEVDSVVDHPNDVFDKYGRMIGDIIVTVRNGINLNHWLAENGWALPTYYNSMSAKEIKTIAGLADKARKAKAGGWAKYSNNVVKPDLSLEYRKGGPVNAKADVGSAVMPKLFRRQVRYSVEYNNGLFPGTFPDYVAKSTDQWVETKKFLQNTSVKPAHTSLGDVVSRQGKFGVLPGDIVFFEDTSTLVDSRGKKLSLIHI